MAKNKKSFVLYSDQRHVVDLLTDEQAGKLLKHLFAYVNDEDPQLTDQLTVIAFEPIKQQLKRDLEKYEDKRRQWSEAGKKSAEKRKQRTLTDVQGRSTDSTVNVNVNDNVNVTQIPLLSDFVEHALKKKPNLCKESVELKYDSWVENGWKNGNDKPIKNWRSTLNNTIPYLKEVKNDSPYPLKKGSREYNVELQVGLIDVNGYPTKK